MLSSYEVGRKSVPTVPSFELTNTAGDLMTHPAVTVRPDDPVELTARTGSVQSY